MKLHTTRAVVTSVLLACLASCGGNGTARIQTKFVALASPYPGPGAMRQVLQSNGITVYAMLCGLADTVPQLGFGSPTYFIEATIDKADLAKALTVGPFSEVTAQTEGARGLQAACGT